jgi:hypothetical protein
VKCVGFVALATFTCYSSTLIGQVLVEQTRREELHAEARTRQTQQIEVALRERIEALKNAQTVSDWAWDHEFSGPGLGAPIQSKTQSSTAKGKAVGVPKRSPVTTPESDPVTVHVRVAVASPPREPASFLPTHSRNQRYGRILAMNRD